LPLAAASRLLFLIARFCLRCLTRLHFSLARRDATAWRFLTGDLVRRPLALAVVMTEGPRWNTHAAIARVGPLPVGETMELDLADAVSRVRSWTIVVYSFPGHGTVASLGPHDLPSDGTGRMRVSLPPGRYSLILRYYAPAPGTCLPTVSCDAQPVVADSLVPVTVNDFYRELARRRSVLYTLLHYHAFAVLKHRDRLPDRFVERIYLPVGNPETQFRYGVLLPHETLQVQTTDSLRQDWDVYVTVYGLASFPLAWQTIDTLDCRLGPFGRRCTYLIRLHPRSASGAPPTDLRVVRLPE
jgi:hypothetical protein